MTDTLKALLLFHILDLFLKGLAWGCNRTPGLSAPAPQHAKAKARSTLGPKLIKITKTIIILFQRRWHTLSQGWARLGRLVESRIELWEENLDLHGEIQGLNSAHSPPPSTLPLLPQLIVKALAQAPLVDLLQIFADCSKDEKERILSALRSAPIETPRNLGGAAGPDSSQVLKSLPDEVQPLVAIRGGFKNPEEIPISGGPPDEAPWVDGQPWEEPPLSAFVLDLGFDEPLVPKGSGEHHTHPTHYTGAPPPAKILNEPEKLGKRAMGDPSGSSLLRENYDPWDDWDPDAFSLRFDDVLKNGPPRLEDHRDEIDSGMGIDHHSFLQWVDAGSEPERPLLRRLEDPPPIFDDAPKPHFGRELRSFVLGRDDTPVPQSGPCDPEFEVLRELSDQGLDGDLGPPGHVFETLATADRTPLYNDPVEGDRQGRPTDLFEAWNTFQPLRPRPVDPLGHSIKVPKRRIYDHRISRPRRSGAASFKLRPDPGRSFVRPRRPWTEAALPPMGAPPEVRVRGAPPPGPRPQSRAGRLMSQKQSSSSSNQTIF